MNTKTKKAYRLLSVASVTGVILISFFYVFLRAYPAQAAINEQINYQGRLLDNTGAVVADGDYNMRFKIYQDGNGCVGGGSSPCGGTLEWTEERKQTNRVRTTNGYYSVNLGSVTAFGTDVDWNQGTLWLSIDLGGTTNTATPTYTGELLPFRRLVAVPQAFNSMLFNGLQSTNFVQLAQGVQTDGSTTNASIFINKTGGTADIITLQRGGTAVFNINNSGSAAFKTTTDSTTGFQVNDADGGTPVLNVDTINERVGIGTAAPSSKLEVDGDINKFTLAEEQLLGVIDVNSIQGTESAVKLIFGDASGLGGAEFGGFDIGATHSFNVINGTTGNPLLNVLNTGVIAGVNFSVNDNAINVNAPTGESAHTFYGDNGVSKWQVGKRTDDEFQIYDILNTRDVISIQSDADIVLSPVTGNVGIGEIAPAAKLDVAGAIRLGAATSDNNLLNTTAGSATTDDLFWGNDLLCDVSATDCGGGTTTTLQGAYDATSGNTITLTDARDLTFTAPDTATDPNIVFNLQGAGDFNVQDAGTTRFSVNDAGQVIIGGGSPFMNSVIPGFTQLTLNKDSSYAAQAFQVASTTAAESGVFFGARSRGTVASPTESQNGDTLFQIAATGYTTSNTLANLSGTQPTLQFVQDAASTATAAPAALIYKPSASGASALHIPSSGSVFLGKSDGGVNVTIGDGSASATPDLFVLDQKSTADDPSGTNGAMYYNSSSNDFRCYANGAWKDCAVFQIDNGYTAQDEFISGGFTDGIIGALGWSLSSNGTSTLAGNTGIVPTANRPGILQISTGSTSGNGSTICLSTACTTSAASIVLQAGTVIKTAVAPGVTMTTNAIRVGATTQINNNTEPLNGVWWEADTTGSGQAFWRYCYGDGATPVCNPSTVAVNSSSFARLEIRVTAMGSGTSAATFLIDGNSYSISGATISSSRVSPNLACYTTSSASRVCYIDYYQIRGVSSAPR